MLLKGICKKKEYIYCILFGGYIAVVLWLTLISRVGSESRGFLWPFHSYIQILKGNRRFLYENIANVLLFIPLGIVLKCNGIERIRKVAFVGFLIVFFIELSQAIFSLGTFECDDFIHNVLGTILGYLLFKRFNREFRIKLNNKMRGIIFLSVVLCMMVPYECREIKYQRMMRLASLHDRDDGAKNLLILNGIDGNAWDTDVYVEFLDDGSIHIKGNADKKSWCPIGQVTLEKGTYSFSGLSSVEKNTVGLVLEVNNERITPDVGPHREVEFTLEKKTEIKAYVIVYDGCDCDVIAIPVIYREE